MGEQAGAGPEARLAELELRLAALESERKQLLAERLIHERELRLAKAGQSRLAAQNARLTNQWLIKRLLRLRAALRTARPRAYWPRWLVFPRAGMTEIATEIAATGLLDAQWYRARYPDLKGGGMDPALHYARYGTQGFDPNPLFDTTWYLEHNPTVHTSGMNPLIHYLRHGAAEGRNPSPFFDTNGYLARNPDVAAAGINPLAHFLEHGFSEGRPAYSANQLLRDIRIAVIVHIYYADIWDEIATYLQQLPIVFDLYVSVPKGSGEDLRQQILNRHSRARIVEVENAGRDIGAFFAVLAGMEPRRYCAICKIHTKHGSFEPQTWRYLLLRGTLGDPLLVARIVHAFASDPDLAFVGPRDLYLSSVNFMLENAALVRRIAALLYPGQSPPAEWGFFAGTMFWFRPAMVEGLAALMREISFESDNQRQDGQVAHALERLFGMIAAMEHKKIGLTDVFGPTALDMALDIAPAPGHPRVEFQSILEARDAERRHDPLLAPDAPLRRWTPPSQGRPGVNLVGPIEYPNGLGVSARGYMAALEHVRVPLNVIPWRAGFERLQPAAMAHPSGAMQSINLIHINLDLLTVARLLDRPPLCEIVDTHRYNIGIFYWELASVPSQWIEVINRFDEIWCASSFMASAISSVTRRRVRVVRPALEPINPSATGLRRQLGLPPDRFVFFYAAEFADGRKNPQAFLEAYAEEFSLDEGAFCLLKLRPADAQTPGMATIRSLVKNRPDIVLLDKWLDGAAMRGLYEAIDCYVSPHRSEGLGLTLLEAMNAGKPVIATGYGGVTDFVNDRTAYVIEHNLVEVGEGNSPYPENFVWADPLPSSLRAALRSVFSDRDAAEQVAARGQAWARDMFSLETTGVAMARAIARIWREGLAPATGRAG